MDELRGDTVPDEHVGEELLALHFLGELEPAHSDVIHRHLNTCTACRAGADEVVETLAALAQLTGDKAVAGHSADRPLPAAAPAGRRRPARGAGGSTGPGARGTASRRARLARAGGLLALVLIIAGLGLGALVRGPGHRADQALVTAAATATDRTSGASASVLLTESDDEVDIRATVNGLRPGTAYVLYAVTSDGQSRPVSHWTGTDTVQDVSGELRGVQLKDLSFFTVSPESGGVAVSVYLPGAAGAPAPDPS
ncbi:anti-sigma factor family protein [Actinoplanes sp. NPDC051494]|uniref:anti-sigma factor family protein n=1 Tax=Actinoplanes sp. NPDC051494 TaxID=3363907 RepID=UPI003789551D